MVFIAFINTLKLFGIEKFRKQIWYSIAITLVTLCAVFLGLQLALNGLIGLADNYNSVWFSADSESWLRTILVFVSTSGLIVALAFIMPTTLMIIASFFTDAVSEIVEQQSYATLYIAKPLGYGSLIKITGKFIGIYILSSVFFIILLPFPVVNVILPFLITSFIVSQEYFSFAALRVMDASTLKILLKRHKWALLVTGVILHVIALTPFLNLLSPLIATAIAANLVQQTAHSRNNQTTPKNTEIGIEHHAD